MNMIPEAYIQEIDEILSTLACQPTQEAVWLLRPSAELQARVSELLAASKAGVLSPDQTLELDEYLKLEHIVRLAKSQAAPT